MSNYYSLNTIVPWVVNTKVAEFYITKATISEKNLTHIRIILEFFEKCQGIAFILQSYRYVANEQPCLKSTGPYDDLLVLCSLFHFFLFHIQCSHLIQFMFSNFSISYLWCSFSSLYEVFKISVSLMTWADTRWQLGTTPSFPYPRVPPVGTLPFRFCNGAM